MIYDSRHDLKNRLDKAQQRLENISTKLKSIEGKREHCDFYATVIAYAIMTFIFALAAYCLVMA